MMEESNTANGKRAVQVLRRHKYEPADREHIQPLANNIIYIKPEELQYQHEDCDKKCGDERTYERADYEFV